VIDTLHDLPLLTKLLVTALSALPLLVLIPGGYIYDRLRGRELVRGDGCEKEERH
jgi:hypothetical protein